MIKFNLVPVVIISLLWISNTSGEEDLRLIDSIKGELIADTYNHYQLFEKGDFKLELISVQGDADLYVTDKHNQADYSNYDAHSITYGVDEILISKYMQRPIAIGIYAHPYYFKSDFILNIYARKVLEDTFDLENESGNHFNHFNDKINSYNQHNERQYPSNSKAKHSNKKQEDDHTSFFWSLFFKLIEFLAEVVL